MRWPQPAGLVPVAGEDEEAFDQGRRFADRQLGGRQLLVFSGQLRATTDPLHFELFFVQLPQVAGYLLELLGDKGRADTEGVVPGFVKGVARIFENIRRLCLLQRACIC